MGSAAIDDSPVLIAIVDGQDVVHAGVEAWLTGGGEPPVKIVGNYSDPADFIADHPIATSAVDVVLMALQYEGRGPDFAALRQLSHAGHRVIVYSYLCSDEIILTSLDAGAVTFVGKFESGRHLREAIYAARSNTPYLAPRAAKALINDRTSGRPSLTQREREVLVAWFQTENKEVVGRQLNIELTTVRTHLQRVRAKYAAVGRSAPTKAALIARAIQDGILSVEDL
jgi:DNA-binding NarL/FixJ family response regulator